MFIGRKHERVLNSIATFARITKRLEPLAVGTRVEVLGQDDLLTIAKKLGVEPVWYDAPKRHDCGGCCPLCCECAAMGGWHTACHCCAKHCKCDQTNNYGMPHTCACCLYPECGHCTTCYHSGRPDFGPRQVRCLCQVKKGQKYISRNSRYPDCDERWTVLGEPYRDRNGFWVDTITASGHRQPHSLVDRSVVQSAGGHWNECNWLEFADGRVCERRCPRCKCAVIDGCCGNCRCPCYVRHDCCSSEPNQDQRVNHGPRQVRSVCQVVMGRRYRVHFRSLGSFVVTVTSGSYPGEGGGLRFNGVSVTMPLLTKFSLADLSVTRYTNGACSGYGGWSPDGWLEFIDTCYACPGCPCGCWG